MRIFECVKFVIGDVCVSENVFPITSDSFGSLSEQQYTIRRGDVKLQSLRRR